MPNLKVSMGDTITVLLEGKKYSTLRDILVTMNPIDVAALFSELPDEKLPLLFRLLPKEQAAETFIEMEEDSQALLIAGFSDSELKEVVDELYIDDAVDLVEEMPANVVMRILRQADPETRKMINEILKYPEESAGSIMTTEFVSLRPMMTCEAAIKHLRRNGVDKETINTCYVTDDNRRLLGTISLRGLLLSKEDSPVAEQMQENVVYVGTLDDQEEAIRLIKKYDLIALPVVDAESRLVGIITIDDAIDVMQEEATEDIEIMAAIVPTDKPYMKMSVFETYKKRIPWLLLLMISATFTGMIITSFEDALAAQMVLSAFIPMLMGTGGNCGGQASVTITRALSLGDVDFKDIFQVMWKEVRIAILCGLTLAVANFVKLIFFDQVGVPVAAVVCLTLIVTVFCAKLVGCTLPMISKKLGFDPAVMASPFITTILDAVSLIIYFQIATALLGL